MNDYMTEKQIAFDAIRDEVCPECGSSNIEVGEDVDIQPGVIYLSGYCGEPECRVKFTSTFTLSSVEVQYNEESED